MIHTLEQANQVTILFFIIKSKDASVLSSYHSRTGGEGVLWNWRLGLQMIQ
jgi:hypothetical protein